MRVGRLIVATALFAGTVAPAFADAISERQQTMKDAGAAFYRDIGKTVKGEQPFELAKVQGDLDVLVAASQKMPSLFPDTSKTGGETKALPTIWEDKADFNAKWQAMGKVVTEQKAAVVDLATLKVAQTAISDSCNACHKNYRARSN